MSENRFDEYLVAILTAISEGRIEAREMLDMTPEQREAYKTRLVAEEKSEIAEGLSRHETPTPEPVPDSD